MYCSSVANQPWGDATDQSVLLLLLHLSVNLLLSPFFELLQSHQVHLRLLMALHAATEYCSDKFIEKLTTNNRWRPDDIPTRNH